MWIAINYFSWAGYLIGLQSGLGRNIEKKINQQLFWTRLFYLLVIISQVVISIRSFHRHPLFVALGIVITIAVIILTELAFNRKQVRHLSAWWIWGLLLLTVVAIIWQTIINY
ncbi:DUF1516 family protein [Lentilactobacillus kribbianus]|uniref:DUF1516 family protein n=1 Tax=Lentilactobacillus kribbianus TaxID=2729622 RepID=UPI001553E95C|nr:DUF1516 family protein [Lentilactobacillus kribbianus]